MKFTYILSVLLQALLVSAAQAGDSGLIELGELVVRGTGCPSGSASLDAENSKLILNFDEYSVIAGDNQKAVDYKACSVALGIKLPPGLSVAISKADYRGSLLVPSGGSVTVSREYFFAGSKGKVKKTEIKKKLKGNFILRDNISSKNKVWSECGADTNLRINTSLLAKANKDNQLVRASIGSQSIYQLDLKSCQ